MRFNGKLFTILFAIITASLLAFGLTIHARHNAIAKLVERQRELWPKAAQAIELKLKAVDEVAASTDSDTSKEWQSLRKAYLRSTVYDDQSSKITELETAMRRFERPSQPGLISTSQVKHIDDFLKVDQERQKLESDLIGQVTNKTLFLRYPPIIQEPLKAIVFENFAR